MPEETAAPKHLVITVHGIRTLRGWGKRFEDLYKDKHPDTEFHHFDFGFFDFPSFILPPARSVIIRRFVDMLARVRASREDRVDIVAHSFGTYVVAKALEEVSPDLFKAHTVVFCGSVLPRGFRWERLIESEKAKRIVNDCALNDFALVATQFFVLGTGIGGLLGFYGMNTDQFANRYFEHGHGGFFSGNDGEKDGPATGGRMLDRWGPLLSNDEDHAIKVFDERDPNPSFAKRIWLTFLNNFAPLRLVAYIAPLVALCFLIWNLQLRADANEAKADASEAKADANEAKAGANEAKADASEAKRKALEAQNLTESGSMLALVDQITGERSSIHFAKKLLIIQILGQLVSTDSELAWKAARDNWIRFEDDLKKDPDPDESFWFRDTFFKETQNGESIQSRVDRLVVDWRSAQNYRGDLFEITSYLKQFIEIEEPEVRARWYGQALRTANEISRAANENKKLDDVSAFKNLFWRLYLGEMLLVETENVANEMVAFGSLIRDWEESGGIASDTLSESMRSSYKRLYDVCKEELPDLATPR